MKPDPFICRNIYFDKTRNLNGYNLRAFYSIDLSSANIAPLISYSRCRYGKVEVICEVLKYINANVSTKISTDYSIDEYRRPRGSLIEVLTGIMDIAIQTYYMGGFWKVQTYPFHTYNIKIMTLKESVTESGVVINYINLNVCLLLITSS